MRFTTCDATNIKHSFIVVSFNFQRTAVIEIELPGTSNKRASSALTLSHDNLAASADSGKNQRLLNPKPDAKQVGFRRESKMPDARRNSRRPSGEKHEARGRRKTIKEVKLEDELMHEDRHDDDNFCEKRLTKLKKRGENDDSLIILSDVVIKGKCISLTPCLYFSVMLAVSYQPAQRFKMR